jgi:hypothetical protein
MHNIALPAYCAASLIAAVQAERLAQNWYVTAGDFASLSENSMAHHHCTIADSHVCILSI